MVSFKDWVSKDSNMHARHQTDNLTKEEIKESGNFILKERSQKYRYVYFLGNKRFKKKMRKLLKYPVLPYPKGENQRYNASYQPITQMVLF